MEEEAHLVGARSAARGPVGGQMRFPRLDMVLRLTPGAIDVLVDGAAGRAAETGDDEACIDPLWPGLDASDDALHPVPARRSVIEFLEPAQLGGGGTGGGALLEAEDMFAQRRRGRDAERVMQLSGTAEAQHLGCAVMAVGAQHDLHPRPVATDCGDQPMQPAYDL